MGLAGRIVQEIALQVTGLNEVKDLDQKIKDLEGKKAKIVVDADTAAAKTRLDEIDAEVKALETKRAEVKVDADTAEADRKLEDVNREVDEFGNQRATAQVDANTTEADRKIDEIDRELDALKSERAVVEVDADTSDADRKIDEIDRELDALRSQRTQVTVGADTTSATGAFGTLKSAGQGAFSFLTSAAGGFAIAGGAAIAGFAAKAVGDFENAALSAGRLRDALGLTSEQASRWVEVASDVGIGASAIETAFGKVLLAIGKAPPGGVFAELAARSHDGALDVQESIFNVIDYLHAIDDPAKQATEAQRLLGRGWKDAAELIAAGSEQIRAALDDVGDARVMSDEQVEQGREFRDTMDALSDKAEEFSISLGQSLVPALGNVAEAAVTVLAPLNALKGVLDAGGDVPILGSYLKLINPITAGTEALKLGAKAWDALFGAAEPPNTGIDNWFKDIDKGFEEHNKATQENVDRQKDWIATLEASVAALPQLQPALDAAKQKLAELTGEMDRNAAAAAQIEQVQKAFADAGEAAQAAVDDQFALAQSIADAAADMDTGALAAEGFASALDQINQASELDFSMMAIDTVESFDTIKEALEGAQAAGVDWSNVDLTPESLDELKGITPELEAVTQAVSGMRDSIQTELTAAFDTGGIQAYRDKAAFFLGEVRDQFKTAFMEAGATEDEAIAKADELAAALGLLPKQVEIQIKLTQAEAARKALEIFKSDIDSLPPEIRTEIKSLWAQGSTVEALQLLNDYVVAHGQPPIPIDSIINPPPDPVMPEIPPVVIPVDTTLLQSSVADIASLLGTTEIPPFVLTADAAQADAAKELWVANANAAEAQAAFDADPTNAEAAEALWIANANAAEAQATFDASNELAMAAKDVWVTAANAASAQAAFDADPTSAIAAKDLWIANANAATAVAHLNAVANTTQAENDINTAARPRTVQIRANFTGGPMQATEMGGTAGKFGALAGEAGAEFVRYPGGQKALLTGPTMVPPGTVVTSARRTRQILGRRRGGGSIPPGMRGLPRYASGGTVPLTIEITAEFADFFRQLNAAQQAAFQEAFPPGIALQQAAEIADAITPEFADFFTQLNADQQAAFQRAFPPGAAVQQAEVIADAITPEFAAWFTSLTAEAQAAFQRAFPPGSAAPHDIVIPDTTTADKLAQSMLDTLQEMVAEQKAGTADYTDVIEEMAAELTNLLTKTSIDPAAIDKMVQALAAMVAGDVDNATEAAEMAAGFRELLGATKALPAAVTDAVAKTDAAPEAAPGDANTPILQSILGALQDSLSWDRTASSMLLGELGRLNDNPPPIIINLNGQPIASLVEATTSPAVRSAAMTIRAGRA
jgi:hypothetical protein